MVSSRRETIYSRIWENCKNLWESTMSQLWRKLALFSSWKSRVKWSCQPSRFLRFVAFVHLPFSFRSFDLLSLHSCFSSWTFRIKIKKKIITPHNESLGCLCLIELRCTDRFIPPLLSARKSVDCVACCICHCSACFSIRNVSQTSFIAALNSSRARVASDIQYQSWKRGKSILASKYSRKYCLPPLSNKKPLYICDVT